MKKTRNLKGAAIAAPLYYTPEGKLVNLDYAMILATKCRRPGLTTLVRTSWQSFISAMDRSCYQAIHSYKASFSLHDRLGRTWRGFGGDINLQEDALTDFITDPKGSISQDLGPSKIKEGFNIYSLPSVAYTFTLRTPKGCDTFNHVYAFIDSLIRAVCILTMGPSPHVLNRSWPHLFERKRPREWTVTVASTMYIHCLPCDMGDHTTKDDPENTF